MFEQADVPGEDRGGEKAHRLPIRKVPGHDGQYRSLRQPVHLGRATTAEAICLRLEHCGAILRIVAKGCGAFFDLGDRGGIGLTHFLRSGTCEPVLVRVILVSDPLQ
jgi:hypothetical protein